MVLDRRFQTDCDRVLLLNHAPNCRLVGGQDVTPLALGIAGIENVADHRERD